MVPRRSTAAKRPPTSGASAGRSCAVTAWATASPRPAASPATTCLRNEAIRRFIIRLAGEAVRVGQALGYKLEKSAAWSPKSWRAPREGDRAALDEVECADLPKARLATRAATSSGRRWRRTS